MQPCTDTGLKTKSEDFLPTDQSSRYSILKVILLGKQGYNTRKYGTALQFAFTVLRDNTRSYFNFLVDLQKQNKTKQKVLVFLIFINLCMKPLVPVFTYS